MVCWLGDSWFDIQNPIKVLWFPTNQRTFAWCARWAHVLKGESPESARQWEGYSLSQGCPSWGGIGRKTAAKLWPDEQKPYIRQQMRMRLHVKSKSNNCTESSGVDMAGKEGKNVWVPGEVLQAHEVDVIRKKMRSNNELWEVSRGHSTGKKTGKGRTIVIP